jgi:hypothetical protein
VAASGVAPPSSSSFSLKATYNGTSGVARIFVDGELVGASGAAAQGTVELAPSTEPIYFGAQDAQGAQISSFVGALEEIFVKNVSTESRPSYVYSDTTQSLNMSPPPDARRALWTACAPRRPGDNVRATMAGSQPFKEPGVRVLDFTREAARKFYATKMAGLLNEGGFLATQWDGFEVNLLMGASDVPNSEKTRNSGAYALAPSPDWYHIGWPLWWGMGVIKTMEDAAALFDQPTAVECSFMAPGLGAWRPAMAPYVDEKDGDLVQLGLQWHPKMLIRTARLA